VLLKESVLRSLGRKSCPTSLVSRYPSCYGGPPTAAKSTELPPRSHAAAEGLFSCRHTVVNAFRHESSLLTFLNSACGLFFFSFFSGYLVVPAGGGGTFLGGFLVNKFKLRCSGIIKLCLLCTVSSLLAIFIFFIHCPNMPMAGVTQMYEGR